MQGRASPHRQHEQQDGRQAVVGPAPDRKRGVRKHGQQAGHDAGGQLGDPKHNAADRVFGSTTKKKGTPPTTSPTAPKRNAADQMSCELINKKDPPPTPSPAVPISFWEEEARAVPNARGNDGTLLFASFSGRRFR